MPDDDLPRRRRAGHPHLPAHDGPHPYDTRRVLVDVIPGGACRAPVTVRCGGQTALIPCYRHEPAKRQCGACRIIVTERTITNHHPAGVAG